MARKRRVRARAVIRKRRVPDLGKAREWGEDAAAFLEELSRRFAGRAYDTAERGDVVAHGSEYEWAAWAVFQMVEERCGGDEARSIFASLGRSPTKTDKKWEKLKPLLRALVDGSLSARTMAAKYAAHPEEAKALGLPVSRNAKTAEEMAKATEAIATRLFKLKAEFEKELGQRLPWGAAFLK
jgi:hypothetical protein